MRWSGMRIDNGKQRKGAAEMKRKTALLAAVAMSAMTTGGVFATDYTNIYMQEGSKTAIIDGQVIQLGTEPVETDGKLMIPLRDFAEALGKNVYWKDGFVTVREDKTRENYNQEYLNQMIGVSEINSDLSDMNIIVSRLKADVADSQADPADALAHWQENGSFEGVEYFNPDRNVWTASEHLQYVLMMCKAAYSEGNSLYGDAELKEKITKSLDFWVNGGVVDNDNWWYKQIGIPNILVNILLLSPEMSTETAEVLNEQTLEGSIFKETITDRITERPVSSSGANLTDKLITSFKIAAATRNQEEMYRVMSLLDNELRVFFKERKDEFGEDAEGIKADYSFHQHVDQVQFGGYGEIFAKDVYILLDAAEGTKYGVSDRALNEYANYILDGLSWAYRGEYSDFTVVGRSVSRQDKGKGIRGTVKHAMETLMRYPGLERASELKQTYQERFGAETSTFSGNRHFWLSDYMSHNRPSHHVGLKIASNRTKLGEVINDENLLGYYLSDGVTCIQQRGDEYNNIYPLLDWNKLPGTTTPQGGLKNLNDWAEWNGEHLWNWKGNCSFVGGVSDGEYGAAVMDYSRDGMAAHKAWFFFDDCMAALGSGINSYTDMDIYTNLNQCLQNGDVIAGVNGKAQKIQTGKQVLKNADYIWHDGIGYLSNNELELVTEERTEKWSTVNGGNKEGVETNRVFQLGIHHGVRPDNASYEYTAVFGKTAEEMDGVVKNNPVQILRNDDKVQAVYNSDLKMTQAVVWKMGTLELPSGLTVTANKKCMLLIRENEDGGLSITASNPENLSKDLQITVNRTLPVLNEKYIVNNADGTTTVKFRLNEGAYAGSSTVYHSATGFDKHSIMNQY